MEPDSELASIRKELATLRKEMNALRRFITIEFDETTGEPTNINIRCAVLTFTHPTAPGRTQMFFCSSTQGPAIGIWDSREKCRILLSVENDDPQLTLRTAEGKDAVLLRADPADGRGLIAALDNGNPRALMKAAPDNAGVVSVVHDDGHPRIILRATEDDGTFLATNGDMNVSVKIVSDSAIGGFLSVNGPNGTPGVILNTTRLGGAVLVNDPKGKPAASLPHAGFGTADGEEY